jgi:hypothetical protein
MMDGLSLEELAALVPEHAWEDPEHTGFTAPCPNCGGKFCACDVGDGTVAAICEQCGDAALRALINGEGADGGEGFGLQRDHDGAVRGAALDYHERGWYSTPLEPHSKKPIHNKWTNYRIEPHEFVLEFRDGRNLGLVSGEPSGGLADVDLDCPEARALAVHILPQTGAMFGRASAPSSHWLYQCSPPDFRTTQYVDPVSGAMLLELRGTGGQTMAPPSIHPTGEPVEWECEGTPRELPHVDLLRHAGKVAAGTLLARHWPKGTRHWAGLALAGALARTKWNERDVDEFIFAVARVANDEEASHRRDDVRTTFRKFQNGGRVTGSPTCAKLFSEVVWSRAQEWLALGHSSDEQRDPAVVEYPDTGRPIIKLVRGKLPDIVDAAEAVLVKNAESLRVFQRAREIVRVISLGGKALERANRSGSLRRPEGVMLLHPITAVALGEILDRLIRWKKINAKGDEVMHDCPERIPIIYQSRLGFWELPILTGLIEAPCLRPDGTVLNQSGYDAETALYLCGDGWLPIPEAPTRTDAEDALRLLREPFAEFPFVDDADRSVLLSAILTALQRRTLFSAPLHGFSAPTPRSGKSILAESIGIIATGRNPAAMGVAESRAEIRKAITGALREGHLIINLDNLVEPLGSPDLARAVTQPLYADRLLGGNQILHLPTNVLWLATGNNLSFKSDMSSRALRCRIDAGVEQPEERRFKIADLPGHLQANRKQLIAAALTILRAYHQAGRPKQNVLPWGGFDQWSAEIREALVWLEQPDPCQTRKAIIVNDPERELVVEVLRAWYANFLDRAMLTREVVAEAGDDLRSALLMVAARRDDSTSIDPRRLGHWLGATQDRIVDGKRLSRDSEVHRVTRWKVTMVDRVDRVV